MTTVSGNILLLDAVQDTVAFMVAGEERVCIFNDTGTPLTCPTPGGCACVKGDDQAWNALGTHLALVNGAAFYSPQGISGGKPLFRCSDAGCVVAPPNAPTGSSAHLNGLAGARQPGTELLLAVDPTSGSVAWTDGSANFAISASLEASPNVSAVGGHSIAVGGASSTSPVFFSVFGNGSPPCIARATLAQVTDATATAVVCEPDLLADGIHPAPVGFTSTFITNVATGGDEPLYRVLFQGGSATQTRVYLRQAEIPSLVVDGDVRGLAARDGVGYTWGPSDAQFVLVRCLLTGASPECQSLGEPVNDHGPIAVTGSTLYFAVGPELYRAELP